jgi:hypothetical protein
LVTSRASIDLTIQLDDADFTASAPFLTLTLPPKTGPSLSKVSVDVTPGMMDAARSKATVFKKQGNYLLQMAFTCGTRLSTTDAQAANVEVHRRSLECRDDHRTARIIVDR